MKPSLNVQVFKARDDSANLFTPKEVLTFSDMYVGAVLDVFSRGFELLEADEHTLKHMEENPNEYPHASYERVSAYHDAKASLLSYNASENLSMPVYV